MTKPKPPDGDHLEDMAKWLPPPPPEDEPTPSQERRRRMVTPTTAGLAVVLAGGSWDAILDADEAANREWDAEEAAEADARATALEQHEERRRLDNLERRLRVQRAAAREQRRRAAEGETT